MAAKGHLQVIALSQLPDLQWVNYVSCAAQECASVAIAGAREYALRKIQQINF